LGNSEWINQIGTSPVSEFITSGKAGASIIISNLHCSKLVLAAPLPTSILYGVGRLVRK
jgi:hypothetical protein